MLFVKHCHVSFEVDKGAEKTSIAPTVARYINKKLIKK
jgi:hypothetical protein